MLGRQVDEEPRHIPPLPAPSSDPFDRRKPPAWNDVPGELLDRDWVVCGRKKWDRPIGPMPIMEAEATLYGVQHLLNSRSFRLTMSGYR